MSRFMLLPTILLAALFVIYYTVKLNADPYTNIYNVQFKVVRGLSKKSKVFARGVQIGKVHKMNLNDTRGTVVVTLKVLPNFTISRLNSKLEVVSANAFGAQRVEVVAGDTPKSTADIYRPEDIIDGINPKGSEFLDLLKSEDPIIEDSINEVVKQTRSLINAESNLGRLIGDPDLALGLDDAVRDFRAQTNSLETTMFDLEHGHSNLGQLIVTDSEIRENFRDTLIGLRRTLADLTTRLEVVRRGEDTVGELIADQSQAESVRAFFESNRDSTAVWNSDDWFVTNDEIPKGLKSSTDPLAEGLSSLNNGEGTAGSLIKDRASAKSLQETLDNLKASTRDIGQGKGSAARLLTDSDVSDQVSNFITEFRELSQQIHEGIHKSIAAQPVNTIHGALVSVF